MSWQILIVYISDIWVTPRTGFGGNSKSIDWEWRMDNFLNTKIGWYCLSLREKKVSAQ